MPNDTGLSSPAEDQEIAQIIAASIPSSELVQKLEVKGKFIHVDGEKFIMRGVTYGTFRPDACGNQFPEASVVDTDFEMMSSHGINTVRVYTVPPKYVLDSAHRNGLMVMVGLPWQQHLTFLDSRDSVESVRFAVRQGVRSCKGHPAVLCYAIGNEIPAGIVRWYGARRIEKFLKGLYGIVKKEDERALVTYVNFPTTEYLDLPFLDIQCFNVYLESKEKLDGYIQRLHNLVGDQPLVLAEIGLDSMRNGTERQAEILDWQLRTVYAKGCAGSFVFAWTDEWWRGGHEIEDWDFGLVDRKRNAKPALSNVAKAFSELPFGKDADLPLISVVVCSYNGSRTIRDTMEGLLRLDYPHFEVIVIDDGSTDDLASIVSEYPVRLLSTVNNGLSHARNLGMQLAKGEIVAYIDDDAYPDPHWLRYLAYAFATTGHAGIGGPNIAPDDDGPIATAVANSPGGPVHVLVGDDLAEHIPGCNMSFRREALLAVGGFDPVFRAAGDDVDLCWRIQHTGRTIGFHPSAVVWHHRRNSLKAYWKQQVGYGKAEALLENKWPEKYNNFGHVSWAGRIYGNGVTRPFSLRRNRVFHGVWGSAAFQSVYQYSPHTLHVMPLMPEWHMLVIVLAFLSLLGIAWSPLLLTIPLLVAAVSIVVLQCALSAYKAVRLMNIKGDGNAFRFWLLITSLHMVQPFARLRGRLNHGLTPWRRRGRPGYGMKDILRHRFTLQLWSEEWGSPNDWLERIETSLVASRSRVRRGGQFDDWDLQTDCGIFSSARGLLAIEEHGAGRQMIKFRCRPNYSKSGLALILLLSALATLAAFDGAYPVSIILTSLTALLAVKYVVDTGKGMYNIRKAFLSLSDDGLTIPKPSASNEASKEADFAPSAEQNETPEESFAIKPILPVEKERKLEGAEI
jgi:glycosyltransferase involved in cell wall biosynthesis